MVHLENTGNKLLWGTSIEICFSFLFHLNHKDKKLHLKLVITRANLNLHIYFCKWIYFGLQSLISVKLPTCQQQTGSPPLILPFPT